MKFDHQKAFPYPVLRPDINDYNAGEFQVTVEFLGSDDGKKLRLECQIALSVPQIQSEIDAGNASYVIIVSCRATYFRHVILTKEVSISKEFESGQLRGEVSVLPFIAATSDINAFACADINSEFGGASFKFLTGEILALDEPKLIYVDRDLFKPISSVFTIVRSDSMTGYGWRLAFDQPKIQIVVSPEAKDMLDAARNSRKDRAVLINSIYFSAVVEAIQQLKDEEESDQRWAQVIKQQCHNLGIELKAHDNSVIAQKLLRNPLGLLKDYVFEEVRS